MDTIDRRDEFEISEALALSKSLARYYINAGSNFEERATALSTWVDCRRRFKAYPFARMLSTPPGPQATISYDTGETGNGFNLASQDYLGLAQHQSVAAAAKNAIERYGVHSAGSAMLLGNTDLSTRLETAIAESLGYTHGVLFPTGWAAGFGAITSLVRQNDYVVMDDLSHACLHQGAQAATKNIRRVRHLDTEGFRAALKEIRSQDTKNAILVISEGLFSMDSDSPDILALQAICSEYNATFMLDIAHDFGALGPNGGGQLELQGALGSVDLVMGSFSKTFASNGGFICTNSAKLRQFIQMWAGPWMFSNAMSPIQTAVVLECLKIVCSEEGNLLRRRLLSNAVAMRDAFSARGIPCPGEPSAIIPMPVGKEAVGRIASWLAFQAGIFVNLVEFPGVAKGAARFRIQISSNHSPEDLVTAANTLAKLLQEADSAAVSVLGR